MAKAEKKLLSWMDVDTTTVKGEAAKAYDAYKAAQKAASEKRTAFEAAFVAEARKKKSVPDGKTLRFSYNFGKLAVAVDDDTPAKGKTEVFKL